MSFMARQILRTSPGIASRPFSSSAAASASALRPPPKKKKRRLRTLAAPVTVTDAAADRIKAILSRKPSSLGVKIGIKSRGCNGLSYTLNHVETPEEASKILDKVTTKGVTVFIEPKAMMHMIGTEMDFSDTELASEFVFNNPNVVSQCGCGESFSFQDSQNA